MILIEFEVDENELAENLEGDIVEIDYVSFVLTLFIMPVRFQVNGIELFEYKGDLWARDDPIMNLASNGLLAVINLNSSKIKKYNLLEGPGTMYFRMIEDDNVEFIYDGVRQVVTTVKYSELLEAFQKFADKVRKFIWERVPQNERTPLLGALASWRT